MKKISSFLALLLFAFTAFQVRAKESFVDKTPEWWRQATPQMVEEMIKNGADVNEMTEIPVKTDVTSTDTFWRLLNESAQSEKDKKQIDEFVQELENVVSHKSPILMMAVKFNTNPKVIENLIKHGADVNAKNSVNSNVLMYAAEYNINPEIIEILIQHGADVNAKLETTGITALTMAAMHNENPDITRTLIKHGADVNTRDNIFGDNILMLAISVNQNPEVVDILIQNGADINAKNKIGMTVYICAATNQNIEIIKNLMKYKPDIYARGYGGVTALMNAAAKNKNPKIVDILIKQGASINARDDSGFTALIYAATLNENPEMIDALIKNGADINEKDKNGVTALMRAAQYNKNPNIINLLINHGANVNAKDNADNTALDYAQENPYLYNTDAYRLLEEKTNNKKVKVVNHDALNCTMEHNKQICEEANLQPFTGVAMFYHLGNLLSKTSYKNGLVDGKVKAYDAYDAYMYLEADYKQGELLSATCYDKNGKIIQCKCDRFNWRIKQIMNQCR